MLSEWGMQGIDIQQCNAIANSIPQFRTDLWQEMRGSRVVHGQILAVIKKAATAFQSTDGEEKINGRGMPVDGSCSYINNNNGRDKQKELKSLKTQEALHPGRNLLFKTESCIIYNSESRVMKTTIESVGFLGYKGLMFPRAHLNHKEVFIFDCTRSVLVKRKGVIFHWFEVTG